MNEKNYFTELNAINVSDKTEKKNGLTYLSWVWAWGELKKLHPNATYTVYENKDGWAYHTDGRTCWVKTGVTVNGIENIEYLPVMDFRNNSIPADKVTSYDVNKAVQRSLTKAIARHGLGLYIYADEDYPEDLQEERKNKQTEKPPKSAPATPPVQAPVTPPTAKPSTKSPATPPVEEIYCDRCKVKIEPIVNNAGQIMTAQQIADYSHKRFGQRLCPACTKIESAKNNANNANNA